MKFAPVAAALVLATLFLGSGSSVGASPVPPADPAPGRAVFAKWCAPCHGPRPRLAGTLALQAKYNGEKPAALEQRQDLTPELVAYFVRHGVAWMAPFRKTEISDAELASLGAWLATPPAKRKEPRP